MKERPILFNAPMVRALLAGTKTQTRRVVKPQPHEDRLHRSVDSPDKFVCAGEHTWWSGNHTQSIYHSARCPYGKPGDRLWVRETFGHFERNENFAPGCEVFYRADGESLAVEPWRPGIHMPRWASRITLGVTGVRVERLRACNEVDAIAEGAPWAACGAPQGGSHKAGFAQLWEQINGHGSWEANPWVWVVEFKGLP